MLSDTSRYSGVAIHLKAPRVQKYMPKVEDMEAHYLPIQAQNFGNKIRRDYKTKKKIILLGHMTRTNGLKDGIWTQYSSSYLLRISPNHAL